MTNQRNCKLIFESKSTKLEAHFETTEKASYLVEYILDHCQDPARPYRLQVDFLSDKLEEK